MITEKTVARFWEECRSAEFVTDDGKPVRVISPGRASHQDGGDFSDSVMEIDEKKLTGKVEIHVYSDLWEKHGHEADPAYNDIIMHIAMWRNGRLPVRLFNGATVPTIILSENLNKGIYSFLYSEHTGNGHYMFRNHGRRTEILALLHELGLQWFDERAAAFRQMLLTRDPQQLLYQKIARALGYSGNGDTFEKLAIMLPLNQLLQKTGNDAAALQACLFGMAGLLPSQRISSNGFECNEFAADMERRWAALRENNLCMCEQEWSFLNLRPENHPCRRLAGLSYLVQRYASCGLLRLICSPLFMLEPARAVRTLENSLMVSGVAYWSNHSDFHVLLSKACALIGRGKAREIIINAILPFRSAYSRYSGRLSGDNSRWLFSMYPGLPENRIVKFMRRELGMFQDDDLTACQQQGMMHLYMEHCREKDCVNCPLFLCRR